MKRPKDGQRSRLQLFRWLVPVLLVSMCSPTMVLKEIDENHTLYTMRFLKGNPVRELVGDQFLRLMTSKEDKLVPADKCFLNQQKSVSKTSALMVLSSSA